MQAFAGLIDPPPFLNIMKDGNVCLFLSNWLLIFVSVSDAENVVYS